MAIELPIRTQGFPNVLKDLGIITPQQGNFWGFSTLVSPVYLVGANSQISTTTPRFINDQNISNVFANPTAGSVLATTTALQRGRYVINVTLFAKNTSATNPLEIWGVIRDGLGGTAVHFTWIDYINFTGTDRNVFRTETTFTFDVQSDGWVMGIEGLGGLGPIAGFTIVNLKFSKYAELPLIQSNDAAP